MGGDPVLQLRRQRSAGDVAERFCSGWVIELAGTAEDVGQAFTDGGDQLRLESVVRQEHGRGSRGRCCGWRFIGMHMSMRRGHDGGQSYGRRMWKLGLKLVWGG